MSETDGGRHIFISYRRVKPDMDFAYRLAHDLVAAGHSVWIDVEGIEGGETWNREIQRGIDECYAYIIILSPDSMESDWVRNELLYALREKRGEVYPVMYRAMKLPLELVAIQYIDFQDDYDQSLVQLLEFLPKPPPTVARPLEDDKRKEQVISNRQHVVRPTRERVRQRPSWILIAVPLAVIILLSVVLWLGRVVSPTAQIPATDQTSGVEQAPEESMSEEPKATLTFYALEGPSGVDVELARDETAPVFPAVIASLPTQEDLENVGSIWELVDYHDLSSPGAQVYEVSVRSNDVFRWRFMWCAVDFTRLQEILRPLSVSFSLDGQGLSDQYILQDDGTALDGWACHYWTTTLSNWRPGIIRLELSYQLSDSIYDGRNSYPPGSYSQTLVVSVE